MWYLLVIPASNVSSRATELDHVDRWAEQNNLRLNRPKSSEIIFTDGMRMRKSTDDLPPAPIQDIRRVTSIKILGITITNHLSVGDHVRDVISKCAQSLYALKLLRNYGMCDDSLRHVYKVIILSKLLYASPAWWGFTSAADKQRLEASLWRVVRCGLYSVDDPSFSQLVEDMDDNLFAKIQFNSHHVLYKLLPEKTDRTYLRPQSHSFTLSVKTDSRNYINRMLFKDIY